MKAEFEARYVDITWYDKNTVLGITESLLPLDCQYEVDKYICSTVIYPKTEGIECGQLAFRFLKTSTAEPYFINGADDKVALKRVVDTETLKEWWIEADSWSSKSKRWQGKAHRTAGSIKVYLAHEVCQLNIGSYDFTLEQLDTYLADFKSDLWELILDEQSYVKGKGKTVNEGGVTQDTITLINNLLSHCQNILKNPKAELREVQTLKPRKAVKPVNRTFMELATKGGSKLLTSRSTEPSYNVPENRYILYVLERLYKIIKQLVVISQNKTKRYESNVLKLGSRLEAFVEDKLIDKDLVKKDLEKLRDSFNKNFLSANLQKQLELFNRYGSKEQNASVCFLKIGSMTKGGDSCFLAIKNEYSDNWFETEVATQNVFLRQGEPFFFNLLEQGFEYKIMGNLKYKSGFSNGKYWHTYELISMSKIEIVGGDKLTQRHESFKAERSKAVHFNHNNWVKKLTKNELAEQEREKRSIQKRLDFYATQEKYVGIVFNSLEPKLLKFKAAIKKLKSMGVKASSIFPNSMTFVQNPDYQFIHSGYKKIRALTSLTDDDLLLSLEKIEEIGLINMPLLYERWCLLQLIKVLVQNYGYTPTDDWKKELINIIETKQNYQSLIFENDSLKRKIKLSYEPMLENGKTPDFVMDVFFTRKNGEDYKKRFVMDAKFYSNSVLQKAGGISGVVKQLYTDKDYSEEGRNTVFIIHPVKSAITEKVSPQSWGNNSYYGELALFDWDKSRKEYFHQYGAICANPIERLNYLDEFQRMVGMFLQYGIENNTLNGKVDDVESHNFCIACGSHDLIVIENNKNNRIKSAWYECNQCKHFTTYNHCNRCDTRLIKNGDYWTYHSQKPMEPLNIKCPSCESLL